jgi:hypothetical protein
MSAIRALEQVPEEVRAAVAHEDRSRVEVVDQEPERGAGDDRREHGGVGLVEVERDDRERRRRDRADPRGEAVDAVGEVDDVDDEDDPDDGQRRAEVAEVDAVHERQREVRDAHAARDRDGGRPDLARELERRMQVDHVVDRPDDRDDGRSGEDRAVALVHRQPHERCDGDPGEDRHPAQERRHPLRQPALARLVERPQSTRGPPDERRERRRDHGRDRRREQGVESVRCHPQEASQALPPSSRARRSSAPDLDCP